LQGERSLSSQTQLQTFENVSEPRQGLTTRWLDADLASLDLVIQFLFAIKMGDGEGL
jgi:hypothetical protein